MITILDIENSACRNLRTEDVDLSPYNPNNKLVSVGYKCRDASTLVVVEQDYLFFYHEDIAEINLDNYPKLQAVLDKTTLLVGHNLKHDVSWLLECGFKYDGDLYDTMIGEYILARGIKQSFSLKESAIRRGLPEKKSDLIQEYLDNDVWFDQIPIPIILEYGTGDIETTDALYLEQTRLYEEDENKGLKPTVKMSNEYLWVIIDIERVGIKIDLDRLNKIEQEYKAEQAQIHKRLYETVHAVMGDTPINLNSPDQLSQVIYSRRVKDKKAWKELFNIGDEIRGSGKRPKPRPKLKPEEFNARVREHTDIVFRTTARQCPSCQGVGRIRKRRKDGSYFKNASACNECSGQGILYDATTTVAGLKCIPKDVEWPSSNGFSTSKETLEYLEIEAKNPVVKQFLKDIRRSNAIDTYLSTFIEGIRNNTYDNGILHTHLNQCITATGRLSSSAPNFHNQPRGNTFPVRASVVSRFPGGKILDCDFRGLEYRAAAELSGDDVAKHDILTGVDVHALTSQETGLPRQEAKPHTFAPLYGAMEYGKPPAIARYYVAFMRKHKGIKKWQDELQDEAIRTKRIKLPSGREYAFPNAKRTRSGGSSGATHIKNYPVQGFATGDIVPCAGIRLRRVFRRLGLRSLIILTVHDDFLFDLHPDEIDIVPKIAVENMRAVHEELKERYGYEMTIPIDSEAKIGDNWLEGKVIQI